MPTTPGPQQSASLEAATAGSQGGAARGIKLFRGAVHQVQDLNRQKRGDSETDDALSTPSIIQERQLNGAGTGCHHGPRLAVMVHRALNLPGSSSSNSPSSSSSAGGSASSDCYYVRAGLHSVHHPLQPLHQQKTAPVVAAAGHVCWGSQGGLLVLEPHGQAQEMEVVLQLKSRMRLTGRSVLVGSVRVRLSEVLESAKWSSKRHVQLTGHKIGNAGTVLEVQLFLSTCSPPSPLQVLCGTWNVGNALPPPPEQLQAWLKGAAEGEHHLVVVAAQECNYTRDMRRFISQYRRSSATTASDEAPATPRSARAAAEAAQASSGSPRGVDGTPAATAGDASTPVPSGDDAEDEVAALQEQWCPPGAAALDGDGRLLHRPGSIHGALKAKLVDAVDSSGMWERHISSTLGDNYWLVCAKHMFQTRLLLFARADVVPSISHISSGFEATGIGHVGMNKGGVGIGLKVGSTHIAFVGSHLAAHQSKTAQRNRDVAEICRELDLQPSAAAAGADLVTGFHHVVWMGDLNYRLEYGQQAVTQEDSPTPEDFSSLCEAISQERYPELLPLDQLGLEREAGRVYAGFREGGITFAPTFKVQKGEPGFSYAQKRSPAWCDRVLFKSATPHKQATCEAYFTVPDICSSDHKPVAAVLSLPLATHTVSGSRLLHRSHPASPAGAASPRKSASPDSSKHSSRSNSWSSAALARLSTFSNMFGRRSSASDPTLYKLYLSAVSLGDQETWDSLAALADSSKAGVRRLDSSTGGSREAAVQQEAGASSAGMKQEVSRNSSNGGGERGRRKLQLQLVLSGTCMGGVKQQHVVRLDPEAVRAARTAKEQPSLLLHESSVQLLPGPLSQLPDDWLLVQVVSAEGWRSRKTLARGILPLQPVVAAYRSSYKAVPVQVKLESSSAAVGSLVFSAQLISSASVRAGMHEAIRRMRRMAAESREDAGSAGHSDTQGPAGTKPSQ